MAKPSDAKTKLTGQDLVISLNLQRFKEERGMKSATLANRAGLPLGTVNKMLNGQRRVQVKQLARIADALGRDVGDFFRSDPPAPRPLRPVGFELVILDFDIPEALRENALTLVEALNADYERLTASTRLIGDILEENGLPGRRPEASELLLEKAGTKPPPRSGPRKPQRQPSQRGASKPVRPR